MIATMTLGILCGVCASTGAAIVAPDEATIAPPESSLSESTTDSLPDAEPIIRPQTLEFRFEAAAWLPRLTGSTSLDGPMGDDLTSVQFDLDLHDMEATPVLEFSLLKANQWQIDLSGFTFSTSAGGEALNDVQWGNVNLDRGDDYRSSVDVASAALGISVWLWQPIADWSKQNPDSTVDLWFAPVFEGRWISVEQELSGNGNKSSADEDWFMFGVGPALHLAWQCGDAIPWLDEIVIDACGTIGPAFGDGSGAVWQMKAGISAVFAHSFSLSFGYRLFEVNADGEDFEVDLGLEGIYFGAAVRF